MFRKPFATAVLSGVLSIIVGCSNNDLSQGPESDQGVLSCSVYLRGVRSLAKQSKTVASLEAITITLSAENEDDIVQTVSVQGEESVQLLQSFTLAPKDWTVQVTSQDRNGVTIHSGSKTVEVKPRETTQCTLDLAAKFSTVSICLVVPDTGLATCELVVDSNAVSSYLLSTGSESTGDTVRFDWDYLATDTQGISHRISVILYDEDGCPRYEGSKDIIAVSGAIQELDIVLAPGDCATTGVLQARVTLGRTGTIWVFAHAERPLEIADGLVAYYPFNDGSCLDAGELGNHGIPQSSPSPAMDRFGNADGAVYLDGYDDFFLVEDSPSLDIRRELTISCWLKPSSFSQLWHGILNKAPSDSEDAYELSFTGTAGGYLSLVLNLENAGRVAFDSDQGTVAADEWLFFAYSWDGDSVRLYVNDSLHKSFDAPNDSVKQNDYPVSIGAENEQYNGLYRFHGVLDELWIFDRALSSQEIALLRNSGTDP